MQQQEQFIEKDIRKLEKILDHLIETNKALAAGGEIPVSLEIIGEAGIGKTSICAQAAARHDMEFVKIQLSQFDDLGDFTGFPSRAFEVTKGSETLYVKEKVLDVYLNNNYVLTGNDASINCPPKWLAGKTSPLVVLIDDWTRAQPRFQQAMMEFISSIPGAEVTDLYWDHDGSERAEFRSLLAAARDEQYDCIVAQSICRFATNSDECVRAVREIHEHNGRVWFARERFWSTGFTAWLLWATVATAPSAATSSTSVLFRKGMVPTALS